MSDSNLHLQLNRDRFEISEAFLEKYNRPGPRYTSYPTAPVWQDNFGPDDLEQYYVGANAARTPVSLYMHLPFCESLCLFCACNVVITKDHSVAPPYIKILETEIEHVSKFVSRDRPIVQFHWGGGTPTYLTPEQMEQLFRYTAERVAMFSYAHVPWLRKQQGALAMHLPEGMEKFRIFRAGLEHFLDAGYLYIGMDHFARPSDELAIAQRERTLHRNFQGYTTKAGADLYGMGVSAISGIGACYAQNDRDVAPYGERVERRGIATMRGYRLSDDDLLRRTVISRILCHGVLHTTEIEREFGIVFDDRFAPEIARLAPFISDGLVDLDGGVLSTSLLGRIFIRNIAMLFDPYLEKQQLESRPLFSKTL